MAQVASASIARRVRDALQAHAEVLEAYLFGSQAAGTATTHSDIDVAVFVDEAYTRPPDHAARLTADLMQALATTRVDVVVLNGASPLLYHRVLRDGVRAFSRDLRATTTREGRALSRYCDYVPQLDKIDRAHAARIAAGQFGR